MEYPTSRGTSACPRVRLVASVLCAWLVVATPSAHAASRRPPQPPGRARVEVYQTKGDPNTPDEFVGQGSGTRHTTLGTINDGSNPLYDWFTAWCWFSQ